MNDNAIEAQEVINNLLEQIKQLSLSNAILQARLRKLELELKLKLKLKPELEDGMAAKNTGGGSPEQRA